MNTDYTPIGFTQALTEIDNAPVKRGRSFHKLQSAIDALGDESEVFFMLLYSDEYPARRLWLALQKVGINVTYETVTRWRKLHRGHMLIFPEGKVMRGHRS